MKRNIAHDISETGLLPDSILRHGIRRLLRLRLQEIHADDLQSVADSKQAFITMMASSKIAVVPEKANEQHYEVPSEFFREVLGARLKYSCAFWPDATQSLDSAEKEALRMSCERAELKDGMDILELGCGWGSLTLWMAEHYPTSVITAVSNSASQGEHIRQIVRERNFLNVEVITADMNSFDTDKKYDRVVSVEMFEHMRNWRKLMDSVNRWMKPDGKFFKHIFIHRSTPYLFEDKDPNDWMSRWFFSGGMMPSSDLPLYFQESMTLDRQWIWDGTHYEKTSNAWLENMDARKAILWPLIEETYGKDFAKLWWNRWRLFFMACAELFAYNQGQEWMVGHYLFSKR